MRDHWWSEEAACRDEPKAIFFDGDLRRSGAYEEARPICERCPVRLPCLDEALAQEKNYQRFGYFGGMTPQERDREAQRRVRT